MGPSGKTLKEIQTATSARIEVDRDGVVRLYAERADSIARARQRVLDEAGLAEVGAVYRGTVTGVTDRGAWVRLFGTEDGFLPLEDRAELAEGETVWVRASGVDHLGRIVLAAQPDPPEATR